VIIWYCGHSKVYTGDWCLNHGFITCQHIQQIYEEYFKGKIMTVISDCSHSGQWVSPWTRYLEKNNIQPCVHSAKQKRTYLSLVTSCTGFETASSLLMAARGFVKSSSGSNNVVLHKQTVSEGQHTQCCITTTKTCNADFTAPCSLPPDYSWARKQLDERIYLMRNRTYTKWAVVAISGATEDVNDRIRRSRIEDLDEFGEKCARILYSGDDRSPSMETVVNFNSKFPMNSIRLNL